MHTFQADAARGQKRAYNGDRFAGFEREKRPDQDECADQDVEHLVGVWGGQGEKVRHQREDGENSECEGVEEGFEKFLHSEDIPVFCFLSVAQDSWVDVSRSPDEILNDFFRLGPEISQMS